jgi:hypothetical protein
MVNLLASSSGSGGFVSQAGDRLSGLRVFVAFLGTSWHGTESGHGRLCLHPFLFIVGLGRLDSRSVPLVGPNALLLKRKYITG